MSLPWYLQRPGWERYLDVPWLGLDLETTNHDKGDPRNPKNRVVLVARSGRIEPDSVLPDIGRSPVVMVAHNAKFELGWLHRYGADLSNILPWDTMIGEYVLAGNRKVELSLDATARRYGFPGKDPVVDGMMKAGVPIEEIPERLLIQRVLYDDRTTRLIAERQYGLLQDKGLLAVFFTRCILTPVLAQIEANGVRLDGERVEAEYLKQSRDRQYADARLVEITGGINLRSRPQLAEFLYDKLGFEELHDRDGNPIRTASGLRATDADSLESLKATTKEQRHFLKVLHERQVADTRLTKALEVFHAARRQGDVLYGTFNQCVTQTHRLSASAKKIADDAGKERGAQFHNMPREYKRLFRAHEDGRVLTELDYRMLEFMTAVELAHDEQGRTDIVTGHDVHKFTASILRNKPVADVTDAERQDAKPNTFKPLYGGQSGTAREKAYYAAFRERYPEINATQQGWLATVLRDKELRIASGLRFYWPDTRVQSSGYVTNTPSIFNYPVQSFATADIVPIGVTHLFWRLRDEDVLMVNTIHDSVILDHGPEFDPAPIAKRALIEDVQNYVAAVYGRTLWVPLAGEFVTSPHWADKSEKLSSGTI